MSLCNDELRSRRRNNGNSIAPYVHKTHHSQPLTQQQNTMTIEITFCHTCGFRYKAQWLADKLTELLPDDIVTLTPVSSPLGSFVVSWNGKTVYEKSRSFHASEPQPTPSEIDALVSQLGPRALLPEELDDFSQFHKGQIVAGPSPPWAVKHFDPRTGVVHEQTCDVCRVG